MSTLIPKHCSEDVFWGNYFSHVNALCEKYYVEEEDMEDEENNVGEALQNTTTVKEKQKKRMVSEETPVRSSAKKVPVRNKKARKFFFFVFGANKTRNLSKTEKRQRQKIENKENLLDLGSKVLCLPW